MTRGDETEIHISKSLDPYSRIPNDILEDKRMRTETRLVLGWIIGRPPGWKILVWHVKKTLGLSDDRWQTTRKDLELNGHFCATCRRAPKGATDKHGKPIGGQWVWRAAVSDTRCIGLIELGQDAHRHRRKAVPGKSGYGSSISGSAVCGKSSDKKITNSEDSESEKKESEKSESDSDGAGRDAEAATLGGESARWRS